MCMAWIYLKTLNVYGLNSGGPLASKSIYKTPNVDGLNIFNLLLIPMVSAMVVCPGKCFNVTFLERRVTGGDSGAYWLLY